MADTYKLGLSGLILFAISADAEAKVQSSTMRPRKSVYTHADGTATSSVYILSAEQNSSDEILYNNLIKKINELNILENNWDGYGAVPVSAQVSKNAKSFIRNLWLNGFTNKISDLYPNPNGTIIVDFENLNREIVSIEIGKNDASFFTEFIEEDSIIENNITLSGNSLSDRLYPSLRLLGN